MKKTLFIIAVLFTAISFSTFAQYIPLRNSDVRQIANGDTSRFLITTNTLNWLSTNAVVLNNNFWTTGALTANGATTLTSILDVTGNAIFNGTNSIYVSKKVSINGTGWYSPLAVISDNNNTTAAARYSFNFVDGSINKNRTSYAQTTDTSSNNFMFTETGKPLWKLTDQLGNTVLNYDSTNNFIINTPTLNNKLLSIYASDVTTTTAYIELRNAVSAAGILAPQFLLAGNTATSAQIVNEFRFVTSGDVAGHTGAVWGVKFFKAAASVTNRPLTEWINNTTTVYKLDAGGYPYYQILGGAATALVTADATTGKLNTTPILTLYGISAVGTDAYALTLAGTTLTDGLSIVMKADVANTGACTLAINGGAAYALKALHDQDPPDNWIEAASMVTLVWDNTATVWQIQTPDANP